MSHLSHRHAVSIEQITQLPKLYTKTIPPEYLDVYNHMNVRYYAELWGKGAGAFLQHLGIAEVFRAGTDTGHWLLRQVLNYTAEVRVDETVTIYGRMVARSEKRMHNMYWMVNESTDRIAATSEVLVANADLKLRRMTAFSEELKGIMDSHIAEMDALGWQVPLSGAIRA